MNRALIAKWCFRFKDPTVTGLWKQIIRKMYKRQKKMYSPFENGVVSEKHNIELGIPSELARESIARPGTTSLLENEVARVRGFISPK